MLKKIISLICAMLITSAFSIVSYGSEGAYTVNKVNYTYDDGSYAYAIVGGKTVQITAEITKNTSDNIPFVMFVVLYHNNNTLVGCRHIQLFTKHTHDLSFIKFLSLHLILISAYFCFTLTNTPLFLPSHTMLLGIFIEFQTFVKNF